jgi:adenosylcobinamide kinase/adenosylcobinamide-phosphate guanylyltransferase
VPTTVGVAASDRRLAAWGVRRVAAAVLGGAPPLPGRTLVLGPAESGKSAHAEDLLAAEGDVVYLAPGPAPGPDDPDWAARVRRHRDRRPPTWTTLETAPDAADRVTADAELRRPGPALLLDSIGTWLSGQMAEAGAFDGNPGAARWLDDAETGLVDAWRRSPRRLVAVAEETGWGVVPATPAGRLFRERLGRLTRRLADGATVHLVVAGRVCPLQEW